MKKITKIDKDTFLIEIIKNNIQIARAKVFKNYLQEIYVNEKFRNISFGKKILNYVVDEVSKLEYDSVIVTDFDEAGLNFFIKHSFILENDILILKGLKKEYCDKKAILNCSYVSFSINVLLAILKIFIGFIFSLNTIIADGINSATDSLSTVLAVFGLKISNKLENDDYPFGYGKIEAIFNLFIGMFIILTTTSVLFTSIKKIFNYAPINLQKEQYIIYIFTLIFTLLKIFQYIYVSKNAKKYDNDILKTLAKDYGADILLSISVLLGVILTIKVSYAFDILLSIVITLYIIYQAYNIIKENILILLEKQDEELLKKVRTIIMQNDDIFYVHDLFMISSGKKIYMYADIRVDKDFSVEKSHQIAENVNLIVRNKYPFIKSLNLHVEPVYIVEDKNI
ncbi:cation diffusion facilitator family transporter [Oceanivirga salmonicida]|uniref:cation diffusion facilitator family transporter n=1 Tax=Oceanivirga salmonicida TaxID=1769291 RepID=UPI000835518A|nr:cation diffusion facilitator family transporter [Oceanivirga salmonicida]